MERIQRLTYRTLKAHIWTDKDGYYRVIRHRMCTEHEYLATVRFCYDRNALTKIRKSAI